jgi:hypothetical protein
MNKNWIYTFIEILICAVIWVVLIAVFTAVTIIAITSERFTAFELFTMLWAFAIWMSLVMWAFAKWLLYLNFVVKQKAIALTPAEIQSGLDRVHWAEGLIRQLPSNHDGRNSWLLNYGQRK